MSGKADQYKVLGNNCIKNQDFTGAVKNYSLGLKLDPENPILYCNMAQAHLNMRDFVEAEKCAKKAIEHRTDYVKAYYRAAKGALGRHSVYDSMMFLAQGVQNCVAQDVEELFLMAKELSPEFENALRSFRDKEKSQANKKKGSASESKGKNSLQEDEASNSKSSKKGGKSLKTGSMGSDGEKESKTGLGEQDKIQDEVNDIQKKLKNHQEKHKKLEEELERDTREKRRKLEEEEELLKNKLRELEEKKEKDRKALELKEKEKERLAEEQREQDRKDRERKAQELKVLQKKESEEKARLAAQEKRDQELKEQKKKDLEKKERDKKERERKEAQRKLDLEKKAQELARLKSELQNQMKEGSLALSKGLHRKAIDSFSKAFESINSNPSSKNLGINDPMDIVILHFAFSQARIYSDEYSDIIKAIQQLEKMEKEGWHRKLPAIFLLLGKAFIRLNRYSHALYPLQRGLSFIERGTSFSIFSWPGTNDVIQLTDKNCLQDALESSVQTCKQYHKPDAICFYENCLNFNNQHILPSQNIFFSDPDFVGFIHIICQQLCHIYFHLPCWKDYKEKISEVQKLNEKDFLGRDCLTPDCIIQNDKPAIIVKVITIGPDGEEKSSCECTPPPLTPSVLAKEREDIDRSPKKKQRKKQSVNSVTSKRSRKESKSQGVVESTPKESGQQYKDALEKLVAARQNNFGYGAEAPGPHKVSSVPVPSKLGKDEEFVYSYFLEIFKEEGYMSIYKLQEHWEANKELLPVLKPALITHTDLVKFLLDTDGFAVVQDMIGITSELPNISAIVEAKAEVPQPIVYGWTPSPATVLEASKTMSFTAAVDITEMAPEEITYVESKIPAHNVPGESFCEEKAISLEKEVETFVNVNTSTPCTSEENCRGDASSPCGINGLTDETLIIKSDSGSCSNRSYIDSQETDEPVSNVIEDSIQKSDEPIVITTKSIGVCGEISENAAAEAHDHGLNETSFHNSKVNNAHSPEDEPLKAENNIEKVTSAIDSDTSEPRSSEILHSNQNGNPLQAENEPKEPDVNQNLQEENVQPRATWKPRAKLLEWACKTFPNHSQAKLWEAITVVRAQNNYTLSGLLLSVIEDRVRVVLLQENEF